MLSFSISYWDLIKFHYFADTTERRYSGVKAEGTRGEGDDDFKDNFSECSKRWVFYDPLDTWLFFFVALGDWLFLSSLVMIQTCQVNRSKIQSSDKTWIGSIFLKVMPMYWKAFGRKSGRLLLQKAIIGQKVGNQSCILVTCAWLVCSSYNWNSKMLSHHSNPLWAKPLVGTLNPKP